MGGTRWSAPRAATRRRRAAVTCSPRGSRAPAPAASCPRAAATRVRILLLNRRMPGNKAVLTGTLVAETAGESALGVALLALALAFGVGPSLGAVDQTVLYVLAGVLALTGAVLIGRRHPRVRGLHLPRRLRLLGAALAAPLRARRAPVAAPQPRAAVRVARSASSPRSTCRRRSPRSCSSRSPSAAAGSCRSRRRRSARARRSSPPASSRSPAPRCRPSQLAAFFVGTSTVLTVVGTVLALAICLKSAAQASANAGPSEERVRGRPLDADPGGHGAEAVAEHAGARSRRSRRTRSGCRWRPRRARSAGPTAARRSAGRGCAPRRTARSSTAIAKPTCRLGTAASSL